MDINDLAASPAGKAARLRHPNLNIRLKGGE
jgi:hypothetical protein